MLNFFSGNKPSSNLAFFVPSLGFFLAKKRGRSNFETEAKGKSRMTF